ncbi:hypothetical protein ATN00_05465 [Sphingobium baderi]|uniref:Spirocyclase, AveC family n=2 Tax=Sphingomonadaceae TaxID=41297 RepID=A0A0S3EWM2_9SPHN|nr:hypothetical protein ATN00_05465 [Sphingobium baderi]
MFLLEAAQAPYLAAGSIQRDMPSNGPAFYLADFLPCYYMRHQAAQRSYGRGGIQEMQSQMGEPVDRWVMESGSIWLWGILVLAAVALTLKNRRLPLFGLVLIAATSAFWQEFFGDWGAYLAWNPAFSRLPFWGDMAFTTPVKPLFIPFSWGWWFAVSLPLLTSLVMVLGRRLRFLPVQAWAMLVAFPLFFAYQIYVEGSSVANGWWTYDAIVGPTLESDKGQLPLVFPALIALWAGWFVGILANRGIDGFMSVERRFGVHGVPAGWRREARRLWIMIGLFQITFFVVNIAPAMIGRALFGGPSLLVP